MPIRSKVAQLPADILEQLDERLRTSLFTDYVAHAEWLRSLGYEVGKSGIHTYAQANMARIKAGGRSWTDEKSVAAMKYADQRIECLKVAAALNVPRDQLTEEADRLFRWAHR